MINTVKPGMRFREIGEVINRHASMSGFSVVISNFNANVHQFNLKAMAVINFSQNVAFIVQNDHNLHLRTILDLAQL